MYCNWIITTIKLIGARFLTLCCNFDCFREYMRTYCSKYGVYNFVPSRQNITIQQVLMEYHFDDIKHTDVVLDIGAHVGGFCCLVSDKAKEIYAVEPIYYQLLRKNIKINNITNVKIFCCGLGENLTPLEFNGKFTIAPCHNLKYIIDNFCGGHVDFLKCDCEGGEWHIKPKELDGIRRIEMEVHSFNNEKLTDFSEMLESAGYMVTITGRSASTMIIHAKKKRDEL